MSDRPRSSRKPLHERTNSESNSLSQPPASPTTIRIIPKTPPRLLGSGSGVLRDDVYSRNPLPTLPSHFLTPGNSTWAPDKGSSLSSPLSPVSDDGFQRAKAQFSSDSLRTIGLGHSTLHPASDSGGLSGSGSSATGSPASHAKPPKKKLLHIHKDNKTFQLKKDAPSSPVSPQEQSDEGPRLLRSPSSISSLLLAQHKLSDSPYSQVGNAQHRINSIGSCISSVPASPILAPATPTGFKNKELPIAEDPINPSWNFQLVGGVRQVPKTPDKKQSVITEESPLPPLPENSDGPPQVSVSHELIAKPSFQSTETAGTASTASENTNYKVYGDTSAATSDGVLAISGNPNYEILEKSSDGSTHQKSSSDGSNYEIYQKSSEEGVNYEIHQKSSSEGTTGNYKIHHKSSDDSFYDTKEKPTSRGSNYVIHHKSSDSSNYKTLEKSSTGNSNYEIIGSPSPSGSVIYRPRTHSESEAYEEYDEYPSPSSLTSPEFTQPNYNQPTTNLSHESLVIPPLQPRPRRPDDGFGYYKSRSRETLHKSKSRETFKSGRTGSLASISTVLSKKEAYKAIVASGSLVNLPILKKDKKLQKQRTAAEPSTWVPAPVLAPTRSHMNEHPHVWSSQLSTVLSESDGGTDRGSGVSAWSDNNGRRSSGYPSSPSRHSRQMLSISSSLAAEEAPREHMRSDSQSLEPPTPAFARQGRQHSQSSIRFVGDQDEYGDGITDMQDLRNGPSRTRLNSLHYSASISDPSTRTNTIRSSTSSRSRANSILVAAIPTWARVYYGSGERRGLIAPGSSILEADSRSNSFRSRSGSPNTDQFPMNIYSPRRRPREGPSPQEDENDSLEITPVRDTATQGRAMQDRYSRRIRAWSMSSMWSPHLKHDRRAINRSAWVPPSVTWSTEGGAFGRRNIQVVMFIVGFIFPFAWMMAAFLPLPSNPMSEMREMESSTSNLDETNGNVNEYARHVKPMDGVRYESARWWRQLNRIMSFIGLLIIGAVVTLVVVGLHQRWG